MNERINGLWWKARIGYNNQNCDPEVLEKFAELIVRQCLFEVVHESTNYYSNECSRMTVGIVERIKDKFGVEE